MAMTQRQRRLALTAHVATSVGWLGAVASFLGLAVAGLTSGNAQTTRSSYLAMGVTGWYVIVPLCLATLATGVACSLGTTWGLLRHYWVVVKLAITAASTALLLLHMGQIGRVADLAAGPDWSPADARGVGIQLVVQSGAAVVALLAATALSVLKPQGRTRHGQPGPRAASVC